MNFRNICSEISIWFEQVFHIKNFWIVLPGLIAVLLVYTADHFNICTWLLSRIFHERLAPWLVLIIVVFFVAGIFVIGDPLMIYLAALAMVFLIRELDDTVLTFFGDPYLIKSRKLVYILLVGMCLWAFNRYEKLFDSFNRSIMLKVSFFGVLWTYFLSQLIARRVFRGILPNEGRLHVSMEESVETAAHLFLLVFALCCFFLIPKRNKDALIKP